MICPARIVIGFLLAGFAVHPGRADIIVNWLDTPIDLSTEFSPVYYPLDLNSDGVVDYTFAASITSVGFFREEDNQYLIVPSPVLSRLFRVVMKSDPPAEIASWIGLVMTISQCLAFGCLPVPVAIFQVNALTSVSS